MVAEAEAKTPAKRARSRSKSRNTSHKAKGSPSKGRSASKGRSSSRGRKPKTPKTTPTKKTPAKSRSQSQSRGRSKTPTRKTPARNAKSAEKPKVPVEEVKPEPKPDTAARLRHVAKAQDAGQTPPRSSVRVTRAMAHNNNSAPTTTITTRSRAGKGQQQPRLQQLTRYLPAVLIFLCLLVVVGSLVYSYQPQITRYFKSVFPRKRS